MGLIAIVRRVVGARVADREAAEDLVQETLARVLAAGDRVEEGMLEPYAIVTARNLVASRFKEQDRHRRNQHRVVDLRPPETPGEGLLAREEQSAVARALARLSDKERETLLAHEVSGQDTRSLRAGLAPAPAPSRRSSTGPAPGSGSSTSSSSSTSTRPPGAAARCSMRCPAGTGADSGRSTQTGTWSSASRARG